MILKRKIGQDIIVNEVMEISIPLKSDDRFDDGRFEGNGSVQEYLKPFPFETRKGLT